ncbi:cadherin EGF LAG seven-pass G-type receptor 3 isoform X1 [Lates japonicus]|uniref:Cadherin EGF LAG seven-pass G-type receptor 3 isoform X1 n=1 Tax=Lates japonicus TaxID=270547 RepID=A0AAD3MF20_LATJO|nr:cadherin EGF LAG seven-pass G-type receptor 3 isoform X1 [Lates japonicus]
MSAPLRPESVDTCLSAEAREDYGMLFCHSQLLNTVMDVNDNCPEFLQKEYSGARLNDAVVGTKVTISHMNEDRHQEAPWLGDQATDDGIRKGPNWHISSRSNILQFH